MKISIGIPVYGVEKFIRQCARSLFEQTYDDIEFIFVDDKSPDNSISILKETLNDYPNRINQVKIIKHLQNLGLASARNTALDSMTGDFIFWVDSDDYISLDAIEKLVAVQNQTNADIVTCGHYNFNSNKQTPCKTVVELNKANYIRRIIEGDGVDNSIWGRLIRRSLYVDNNIRVEGGCSMGEDLQVIPRLLYFAEKHEYCDERLYFYRIDNESSYTSSFSEGKARQALFASSLLINFFSDKNSSFVEAAKLRRLSQLTAYIFKCGYYKNHRDFFLFLHKEINILGQKNIKTIPLLKRLGIYIENYKLFVLYAKIIRVLNNSLFCILHSLL